MDLKQGFKIAIEFEQKGRKIYLDIANKTNHPILKKTFSYLAEQELFHEREIEQYIENIESNVKLEGDSPEQTKQFFTTTVKDFKEKLDISDDDIKAHETALGLEQSSIDFYKEQLESTDNQKAKAFFKFLIQQEQTHYDLIKKAYEFIKDPEAFYTEQEGWLFEG